jgi:cell wall assembly regulator SMI1
MNESLDQSLRTLEKQLNELGRPVIGLLNEGISQGETARRMTSAGLALPADLAVLYEWHDGTSSFSGVKLDDLHLIPGFYFPDLDEALTNYEVFKSDSRWDEAWLPVLANGGGDFYAVDCTNNPETAGQVHNFMLGEAQHPVEYLSLTAMFATYVQAFRQGIYFLHPSGYLDAHDQRFFELAKTLNPEAPGWDLY